MSYLGSWGIDDFLTFPATTHRADTGALTDADSAPTYRIYEDETGTAILTGSMAKLDDANTTGFYTERIQLTAANGLERGKSYSIYIEATVNSITGGQHHTFQIGADVNVTHYGGTAGTFSGGRPEVNTTHAAGTAWGSGAITAASVATDAVAEIADAVWDEDATGHQTQGAFGQVLGDSQADGRTIWSMVGDISLVQDQVTTLQTTVDGLNDLAAADVWAEATRTLTANPGPTAAENATAVLTTPMTESYAADGAAMTVAQALYALQQYNNDRTLAGVTMTVKKLDGTTTAYTLTVDDGTNPTTISRTA